MIAESIGMKIKPFKAYRYDANVVGNAGACISPPYDVIDPTLQDRLYEKSPHNIVRIIQGKTSTQDSDTDNVYSRAGACLEDWIESGALKQDERERIYAYIQNFEIAGVAQQRSSFIGLMELEPFGGAVKPHEEILQKPMEDRLKLKRATGARFGLIFLLYDDPERIAEQVMDKAQNQPPLLDFADEQAVRHRLYAIDDPGDQEAITTMMGQRSGVIADGHHRYTTGLALQQESSLPGAKYQMAAFANIRQEGVIVLATHRLVHGLADFTEASLVENISSDFAVHALAFSDTAEKTQAKSDMLAGLHQAFEQDQCALGIYGGGSRFYLALLRDRARMQTLAPGMSVAWQGLDVAVLHKAVLEAHLGLDETKLSGGQFVTYVKDTPTAIDDSIAQVDDGRQQVAFFINPIKMEQLFAVTETGERMPQKSTYFYPKMYTGLTIQKL